MFLVGHTMVRIRVLHSSHTIYGLVDQIVFFSEFGLFQVARIIKKKEFLKALKLSLWIPRSLEVISHLESLKKHFDA